MSNLQSFRFDYLQLAAEMVDFFFSLILRCYNNISKHEITTTKRNACKLNCIFILFYLFLRLLLYTIGELIRENRSFDSLIVVFRCDCTMHIDFYDQLVEFLSKQITASNCLFCVHWTKWEQMRLFFSCTCYYGIRCIGVNEHVYQAHCKRYIDFVIEYRPSKIIIIGRTHVS